jgi:hypothetical protein
VCYKVRETEAHMNEGWLFVLGVVVVGLAAGELAVILFKDPAQSWLYRLGRGLSLGVKALFSHC